MYNPSFTFQSVHAWQKAHEFTLLVYELTKNFPDDERFGLVSQFRRAAVSIGANIAEGYKKIGKADKLRFLNIAEGSMAECMNYILLSYDLHFISEQQFQLLCEVITSAGKLLTAYSNGIINNNGIKTELV